MTAAHCLTGRKAEEIQVVVGDHDTSTATETNSTVFHTSRTLITHEKYDSSTGLNDIALIRLATPITYNSDVGPVCLPFSTKNNKFENTPVTLAGWGTTEFGGPKSKKLQKVDVTTTTMAQCKANYPSSDDTMFCTIGVDKDSCQVTH